MLISRRHAGLAALALIAGCGQGAKDPGPLTFSGVEPIRLAVGSVEVVPEAAPPAGGFISKRRSDELQAATESFLRQRVVAGGGLDGARVTIEEASIVERAREEVTGGLAGVFTREPLADFIASLGLRVAILDDAGLETVYTRSRVEVRRPILEGTGVLERDTLARELSRDLIEASSQSLQAAIEEDLANYIAL